MNEDIDFLFAGELLSDHGMAVCYFEGGTKEWSGGSVTFTTSKPPNSDRQTYYTSSFDEVLVCNISIGKNPCTYSTQEEMTLTQEEYGGLMRWLVRPEGYHWLQFNTEGYEDVYFNCYINAQPHMLQGNLVGLDLTITCDAPYGYSKLYKKTWTPTDTDKYYIKNYSDKPGVIYPKCNITTNAGDIILVSGIDGSEVTTKITNNSNNSHIELCGDTDVAIGFNPGTFNYQFPVLQNSYGDRDTYFQVLRDNTDAIGIKSMDIEWRFIRWVVVP